MVKPLTGDRSKLMSKDFRTDFCSLTCNLQTEMSQMPLKPSNQNSGVTYQFESLIYLMASTNTYLD